MKRQHQFFVLFGFSVLALVFQGTSQASLVGSEDSFIVNSLSGKCIDVAGAPGNGNGAKLQLWDCERSGVNTSNGSRTDQTWILTNDGFIINSLSGKCIDVSGAPGISNGAKLQLWDCERSGRNADNGSRTDQQWKLHGGFIVNTLSGKCVDVAGAPGQDNRAQLQLWDCERSGRNANNGSRTDQRWLLNDTNGL
ncbi:MAG TPA: RICIN domain-containing protein [Nostocaceae cyanobacterium]|nr:RICIN domain-containing protein [Nostocaceae cyanobacterium]